MPRMSKRTGRITFNVWGYDRPHIPFGVESFEDGISDGDVICVLFCRYITETEYAAIESWIDDKLTGGVFYLISEKVYFSNEYDALTFKMMYAMVNNLLDF